ncbi:papain-like cysteine protease family protein [Hyalangium rubrum]|uniref:Papain-like cysteine protease family protein n=1 Tax=Hyalangium rubrum TaxID=3103134 RepID=A0ABU5HI58_9BACT|nr:papain-like cysteine protease family protein [Hyalangium sp. s54d21]MDY7232837.1 papain-like cysteine protease family protein [Hyalangium sp. s54d21]
MAGNAKALLKWVSFFAAWLAIDQSAMAQPWEARYNLTPAALQEAMDTLSPQGYVPIEISGVANENDVRYHAAFVQQPEVAWQASFGLNLDQFTKRLERLKQRGFVPVSLAIHSEGTTARYGAIWQRKVGVAWEVRVDMDAEHFQALADKLTQEGYVPASVVGYAVDGEPRYAALWTRRPGVEFESRSDLSAAQYQAQYDRLTPLGFVPVDISVYSRGGETRYAAIWERMDGADWQARSDATLDAHAARVRTLAAQDFAPYVIAPYVEDGEVRFAGAWRKRVAPVRTPDVRAEQAMNVVPAGTGGRVLDIAAVRQQTHVWCWLAVGEMVFQHYGVPNVNPAGNFQCGIIGRISHPSAPCGSECFACVVPSGSNRGTLSMLSNYARAAAGRTVTYSEAGAISPAAVLANIDAGQPVIAGISYNHRIANADAEHVVLIVGYQRRAGRLWLVVNDPFPYGTNQNPFLKQGGVMLAQNQYRIRYADFRDGVFWHWSVFNLQM